MPGYLIIALACVGLWLVFPKGFKYLVGSLVGTCAGGFVWGLGVLAWTVALGNDVSWHGMGWSFLGCVVMGIVGGCVLAARG